MLNFKNIRLENSLSQKDVAAVLGITQQAYANYERGAREADYKSLETLAKHFNVSVDYLLGREDKKISSPSKEDELIANLNLSDSTLKKLTELLQMVDELSDENFNKLIDYANLVAADQQRNEAN